MMGSPAQNNSLQSADRVDDPCQACCCPGTSGGQAAWLLPGLPACKQAADQHRARRDSFGACHVPQSSACTQRAGLRHAVCLTFNVWRRVCAAACGGMGALPLAPKVCQPSVHHVKLKSSTLGSWVAATTLDHTLARQTRNGRQKGMQQDCLFELAAAAPDWRECCLLLHTAQRPGCE